MWLGQLLSYCSRQVLAPGTQLRRKYQYFRDLLAQDRHCLEKMAEIEEIHYRRLPCDYAHISSRCRELVHEVELMLKSLIAMNPLRYRDLRQYQSKMAFYVELALSLDPAPSQPPYTLELSPWHCSQELVGGKALHLAQIKEQGYPVPAGFCISTRAFNRFLEVNQLRPRIDQILSRVCLHTDNLFQYSRELQELIMQADVPEDLVLEVQEGLKDFQGRKLALRSSAFGEDSELSFAGQYVSLLNVDPSDWLQAYKQVLASKYSGHALSYRIRAGLPDELLSMAVLVLEMVPAQASGVVYSSDPSYPDRAGFYIVQGLGDKLVGGTSRAREIFLAKNQGPQTLAEQAPYLPRLAEYARALEEFFGCPQDIEWAADAQGQLSLLQARPLQGRASDWEPEQLELPVLARGQWASSGLASGQLFRLDSRQRIPDIPEGAVVLVQGLYPELTEAVHSLSGIVAVQGSVASHLATVARETGLPIVINIDQDPASWEEASWITLNADQGLIYSGAVPSLPKRQSPRQTWLTSRMQKILSNISTLNLRDAQSQEFVPQNCRSLHDLIRFAHEMGVREMFSLADPKGKGLGNSKTLQLNIPLAFRVLDLEQGLKQEARNLSSISTEQVSCRPFKALFNGLTQESIPWDPDLWHFDWQEFDKLSAGIFNPSKSAALSSYALVARDYIHALFRFGYHFAVLDALLTPNQEQNYAQFSFKGGGGGEEQKILRLQAIQQVLEHFRFQVEIKGEMLTAEISRESEASTSQALAVLGYILGRTRLLDLGLDPQSTSALGQKIIEEIHAALAI
ncbi:MAG: PEP/pyruvate-binding domain-containing protein [Desulfohalobiaceae bacterium]